MKLQQKFVQPVVGFCHDPVQPVNLFLRQLRPDLGGDSGERGCRIADRVAQEIAFRPYGALIGSILEHGFHQAAAGFDYAEDGGTHPGAILFYHLLDALTLFVRQIQLGADFVHPFHPFMNQARHLQVSSMVHFPEVAPADAVRQCPGGYAYDDQRRYADNGKFLFHSDMLLS